MAGENPAAELQQSVFPLRSNNRRRWKQTIVLSAFSEATRSSSRVQPPINTATSTMPHACKIPLKPTGSDRTGSGSQADVLPCHFIVHERSEFVASGLFRTFGAGFEGSGGAALAHFTQTGTEICLDSFHPAAQTVDVLRPDLVCIVHLAPKLSRLGPEFIVIVQRSGSGVTQLAIKTAISNKLLHIR